MIFDVVVVVVVVMMMMIVRGFVYLLDSGEDCSVMRTDNWGVLDIKVLGTRDSLGTVRKGTRYWGY